MLCLVLESAAIECRGEVVPVGVACVVGQAQPDDLQNPCGGENHTGNHQIEIHDHPVVVDRLGHRHGSERRADSKSPTDVADGNARAVNYRRIEADHDEQDAADGSDESGAYGEEESDGEPQVGPDDKGHGLSPSWPRFITRPAVARIGATDSSEGEDRPRQGGVGTEAAQLHGRRDQGEEKTPHRD